MVLWGYPDDGGTQAVSLPVSSSGGFDPSNVDVLASTHMQRHLAYDGDGDGTTDLYRTAPLEPVALPIPTLDGSGAERLYPATGVMVGDVTGDDVGDILFESDGELVVLPGGAYGTAYEDLEARIGLSGCAVRYAHGSGAPGLGANDVVGVLRGSP